MKWNCAKMIGFIHLALYHMCVRWCYLLWLIRPICTCSNGSSGDVQLATQILLSVCFFSFLCSDAVRIWWRRFHSCNRVNVKRVPAFIFRSLFSFIFTADALWVSVCYSCWLSSLHSIIGWLVTSNLAPLFSSTPSPPCLFPSHRLDRWYVYLFRWH